MVIRCIVVVPRICGLSDCMHGDVAAELETAPGLAGSKLRRAYDGSESRLCRDGRYKETQW